MVGRPSSQSNIRRWHRLIEHYTPDGALGRVLLAAISGTLGWLFLSAAYLSLTGTTTLWFFISPVTAGLALGATILTIVTLWPVYLSLIGNVDSAKDYPRGSSSRSRRSSSSGSSTDEDDPMKVLKREYAAGNVSESEFERRLDTLLDAEESSKRGNKNRRNFGDDREIERN